MSKNSFFGELQQLNNQIEFLEKFLRPGPTRGLENHDTERQLVELRSQRDSLLEIWFSVYDP